MTFVDTNVVLDVLSDDPVWADWSTEALVRTSPPRRLSPIVYAELAGRFASRLDLDRELTQLKLSVEDARAEALFRAGQAHAEYRRRGGLREKMLPDFLIGAQALDREALLITRDTRRFRTAFPDLELVSP